MTRFDIGFLGYGRMARAISAGLAQSGLIPYPRQLISGRNQTRLAQDAADVGLTMAVDNGDLVRRSEVVILGVKPHQIVAVLEEIRAEVGDQTFISLAAGVRLEVMRRALPAGAALIRTMPNVAALVGRGLTLMCWAGSLDQAALARARAIFESVGHCLEIDEKLFDAGGAVSGSGPAYFFTIMESLVRGAVRLGLPWDTARAMVIQTALGSAVMAGQSGQPLAELRDMVTSPGGTTAEALLTLESAGLGGLLQKALEAAAEKSKKLI
ncbi:MAG: pyrroline-5-carboxylate reductase [Candidatus Adiutrix sp.]|jgi:pyrroline-5-carboxylate reductase|nr:pyrroline-5-carboxylate reductase [Candidatus Adiutrix sp.]